MSEVPLSDLVLDEELQPRVAIDRAVLENYVQLLVDGVQFPPVVVFRDDACTLWLADGFHRWHAHKVLDADCISADVRDGSRRDALLYSLSANAKHGLQRGAGDYSRAYETACRNGLVNAADSDAVQALLRCSGSWADKLTVRAREAARAQRDAEIVRLRDDGLSSREIARQVGVDHSTVVRTGGARNHTAETHQDPDPPGWVQKLRELESPEANAWSGALQALRHVNEQVSIDELYRLRFVGFDHVVSEELEKAYRWISELRGRFVNERGQRRRA